MLRLVHTHLSSPASSLTSLRLCCLELFLPSIDFLVILFPWEAPLLLELTASFRAMLRTIPKHVRCPVYNICSLLPLSPRECVVRACVEELGFNLYQIIPPLQKCFTSDAVSLSFIFIFIFILKVSSLSPGLLLQILCY